MINLLNGEWYKLGKSRSFLVCCICIVASVCLLYGMLFLVDEVQKGNVENGTAGVFVTVDGQEPLSGQSVFESVTVGEILQNIMVVFVVLISGIFNIIFKFNAQRTIVPCISQSAVDFRACKNKTSVFAKRDDFIHCQF